MQIQFPSHSFPFLSTPVFNYAQLFLITFSPRAVDIVKCPWSSFFIYDTLILTILHYITLHTSTVAELSTSHGRVHTHTHTHMHTQCRSMKERMDGCVLSPMWNHTRLQRFRQEALLPQTDRATRCVSRNHVNAEQLQGQVVQQGPDLQNILRQSYDYLTIMPKLRSTYDGRLIYKTSYNEREALHRQDSRAKS